LNEFDEFIQNNELSMGDYSSLLLEELEYIIGMYNDCYNKKQEDLDKIIKEFFNLVEEIREMSNLIQIHNEIDQFEFEFYDCIIRKEKEK